MRKIGVAQPQLHMAKHNVWIIFSRTQKVHVAIWYVPGPHSTDMKLYGSLSGPRHIHTRGMYNRPTWTLCGRVPPTISPTNSAASCVAEIIGHYEDFTSLVSQRGSFLWAHALEILCAPTNPRKSLPTPQNAFETVAMHMRLARCKLDVHVYLMVPKIE